MKYHLFMAVLESLTAASHEALEIQVGQGQPEGKHASEEDLGYGWMSEFY